MFFMDILFWLLGQGPVFNVEFFRCSEKWNFEYKNTTCYVGDDEILP